MPKDHILYPYPLHVPQPIATRKCERCGYQACGDNALCQVCQQMAPVERYPLDDTPETILRSARTK